VSATASATSSSTSPGWVLGLAFARRVKSDVARADLAGHVVWRPVVVAPRSGVVAEGFSGGSPVRQADQAPWAAGFRVRRVVATQPRSGGKVGCAVAPEGVRHS